MKKQLLVLIFFGLIFQVTAQKPKVGLVLSGGGAKGLAHVGVLKVLEENNIPVDYIIGTSMGGIVGGLYAAGYNADEIEEIVIAPDFQEWAFGKLGTNHRFLHTSNEDNASFLSFQIQVDSNFSTTFQSNIINDAPLNFALAQFTYLPSKEADYNFDQLNIPFRCIAADIFTQESIVLKEGDLGEALRATMAVPLVFRPIKIDDKYMYDGGLYNNFPIDIMLSEFNPDVIIGVNVSSKVFDEYPYEEDEELIKNSLKFLFLDNSDPRPLRKGDIYIEPDLGDISAGDFEKVEDAIKRGYRATLQNLDSIKSSIPHRTEAKRPSRLEEFTNFSKKNFGQVIITGLNSAQREHVRKIMASRKGEKRGEMSIDELREGYYRLISDNYFNDVYPKISHDTLGFYHFNLDVNANQKATLDIGGNLATRSISAGYVGVKYSVLDKLFYNFSASGATGRFYTSAKGLARITFPTYNPFYFEFEGMYNNWEYSNVNELIFQETPTNLVDRIDRYVGVEIGRNVGKRRTLSLRAGYASNEDVYFSTDDFNVTDELDQTRLRGWVYELRYHKSTLNRKKFPSEGDAYTLSAKYINATEQLNTGTTSVIEGGKFNRDWVQLKARYERYWGEKIRIGIMGETVISNQPEFANFKGTMINAPAFYPLIDSRSIFLQDFRAHSYGAAGIRNVFPLDKESLELHVEGYAFFPYQRILEGDDQKAVLGPRFSASEWAASTSLVYHMPFGPISASVNYYSDSDYKFGFLLNVGYLLFNQRVVGD
ncbi:MAG: patatin-like phospholipase family protein [Flammeovirgaceae bacterium]